jgi:hypothetical protein
MKIHTVVSESHKPLLDIYRASLRAVEPNAELTVHVIGQHGEGRYGTEDYNKALLEKLDAMEEISRNESGPYIFAECDIVWLRPFVATIKKLMDEAPGDVLFQQHGAESVKRWACTGLYATPGGAKLVPVWAKVKSLMPEIKDEEAALDAWSKKHPWRWGYLPESFWNHGFLNELWNPGDPLPIPADAFCLHASWTVGVQNKLAMMNKALETIR